MSQSSDSITLISANALAGGIGRSRTEKRFNPILELLAAHRPAALGIQEALWWDEDDYVLLHRAEQILGMRGVLAIEPTGMHVAMFIGAPLTLTRSRPITGTPWRHGALRVQATLPDKRIITFGSAHLSPRSPIQRLAETQQITTWWDPVDLTIVMGDFQEVDADTDLSAVRPAVRARLALPGSNVPDTRGADHLAEVGFIDLGARPGELRLPTAGHGRDIETRCDRIYASPAAAAIAGPVEVIDPGQLSDHRWPTTRLAFVG